MKIKRLAFLIAGLHSFRMTDEAPAAPASVEPTKESLVARVESLIDAGYSEVANVLHNVIADVENFFGHAVDTAEVMAENAEQNQTQGEDASSAASAAAPVASTGDPATPAA